MQRVADPPAAMQDLDDGIVLVSFADRHQHGGQPFAQVAQPAEPVEPGHELAMPVSQPGLVAGGWRIVGPVAACSHEVPPPWRQVVAWY